ncbi:SpoIIE family protein phosphatase [Micromonospora sp. NPDC050397]|uniref:SpoIIE family protein phosphatase n=1 Tax=Micromonospora sp. NPDC050397 TaxID=3364279 RepID=UPI00384FF943
MPEQVRSIGTKREKKVSETPAGDDEDDPVPLVGDTRMVRLVFDQMPLMVVGMEGPELRLAAATAAFREYVGRQEVIGQPLRKAFAEFAGQQALEIYERVYATGKAECLRDFRVQFDRPDRGDHVELFVDFTITPLNGADGRVAGLIAQIEDVTARNRERQAARARTAEAQRRYEQARDVIDALQRELLPAGLPVLPGVEVAASYLLANTETAAGGDWFDAIVLAGGQVALVVGDVVGHGLAASATMGQLRVLLRERLLATGDLLTALEALNSAASWIPGARAATVCVVLLDPVTGELSYCTAGHPAPLLLTAEGDGRFLPTTGAGPLGVGGAFTAEVTGTATLDPGTTVLLYTDGIIERPGRSLSQASVELAQAAADIAADRALRDDGLLPAERVCTQTLELLTRLTGHTDDITLLAGRRVDPPEPLRLTLSSNGADQLRLLRTRTSRWLAACGADPVDESAVRHALAELVTNSLEHAYPDHADESATCEITVTLHPDGHLRARVRDHGTWREPRPSPDRGLGLRLTAAMVDNLCVDHDEYGTTATVEHALTRPARLLTTDQLPARRPVLPSAQADPLLIIEQPWSPAPRLRIDGPMDAATAAHVEQAVREAGISGTRDLTVDLTGVSHLASAGVAALHRLAATHRANSTVLRLYAPTAGPADMILTLVGLDHVTSDPQAPPGTENPTSP